MVAAIGWGVGLALVCYALLMVGTGPGGWLAGELRAWWRSRRRR